MHGLSYAVTGNTASNYDWSATVHARTPIVLAVVCLLAFCVLLIAFRSILLPLVSIGLNLLSVGAAYGLITLIFQDGHLEGLLGFTSYGAIADWVPLFMFVLLFGLSMDYHVFILSRVRERRLAGAQRPGRARRRHRQQRRRGDQRGRDHGGGVLHLRHAVVRRRQDARRGAGLRRADRRDRRARACSCRRPWRCSASGAWYLPRKLAWLRGHAARGRASAARPSRGTRRRTARHASAGRVAEALTE